MLGRLLVALSLITPTVVLAHMHDRPDLDQWLRTLYSQRGPCCDSTEAETMADPDWRNASEMGKEKCTPSAGSSSSLIVYCVRLEHPYSTHKGEFTWWEVPQAAVVELPNRAGPALVWVYWSGTVVDGVDTQTPFIRCFLPGTLS